MDVYVEIILSLYWMGYNCSQQKSFQEFYSEFKQVHHTDSFMERINASCALHLTFGFIEMCACSFISNGDVTG